MTSLRFLKKRVAGAFRMIAIAALSACTTIHPETISQNLGPAAQEKFQSDFAECQRFAESRRPEVSFKDIAIPLGVAFLFTAAGLVLESNDHKYDDDYSHNDPKYGGMAILGFSLAGIATASWIVIAGIRSRQGDQDAALRACLYERGYTVF